MKVMHSNCAGLDVHSQSVVACARTSERNQVAYEVKTFGTTTRELWELVHWLEEHGCTHAAMESTGVYWKPVWHVLEGSIELVLAQAAEVRNLPGRKSDVSDAQWLSDLLAHGLVRASFVPPEPIQELRALTRTRKQLVREVGQHAQRLQKVLEDANVKLASVLSNVLGASGRAIVRALIEGESDPHKLAELASSRLKASRDRILDALQGRVTAHHRFLMRLHLQQIESLEAVIAEVEGEAASALSPFQDCLERLATIPGVSEVVARVIVAEIGLEMSRFPTVAHLISWAGLCPRLDETAGKRRSTRLRHGAPWLKSTLVQAAWAAMRTKECYLRAQFFRIRARRGPGKAIVAVAASILKAAYFIIRDGVAYRELGGDYFQRLERPRIAKQLVRRLSQLGYEVTIAPAA